MSEFFKTVMGKRFFEGQLPSLIKEIGRVADALEEANELKEKELVLMQESLQPTADYFVEGEEEDIEDYHDFLLAQQKVRAEAEELNKILNDPAINEGIPEKEYAIWSEGYRATGDSGTAYLHGYARGITFKEACKNFARENSTFEKDFNVNDLTYWGCKLFDNEAEARKSFG